MPFRERDVAIDPAAAREVIQRTGQRGVPVIVAGDEVIVGFDRPRLERLAERATATAAETPAPRLGLRVKDAPGGAEIGAVHPGSTAERAGLRAGDVVEQVDGRPVRSAADLEGLAQHLGAGASLVLQVRRDGERLHLRLS